MERDLRRTLRDLRIAAVGNNGPRAALYDIGKPFAMLINFQGIFDHRKRFEMFRKNRVEMLWLNPRVDFIKPEGDGKSGVPFQSGYLCSGIFDNQLNFKIIDKGGPINL